MDVKMDNVNLDSIFDNLKLHAEPMDSSTKNGIDTRRDLDVYRKHGKEEQKGKDSIRETSSSVQERQTYFQQSRWTSRTNNIESEWSQDHYSNPIGCSLLPIHDQSTFPKENKKEELTISAPKPNLSMDNCNGTQSQKASIHDQRFLEIKPEKKDNQLCIWCINYRLQSGRQGRFMYTPARERPLPFPSGSVWRSNSETGVLGVRQLLGDECLDFFMPVETKSPNRVSNNISTQKESEGSMRKLQSYSELVETLKNDRKFREFHEPTDKWLFDQEYRKYFDETYRITNIYPLLVDHSGTVVFFLDDRGILFAWCEMTKEMDILGINKMEGLANYLYHPEKMCAIMEDTGELVPRVELRRRVMEKRAKKKLEREKLAEKNREKRLAKKNRLAEEKQK